MQVYFARSGGFIGSKLKTSFDTKKLPGDEAAEWERLLMADQFLDLPSTPEVDGGSDQFSYELTVISGEWQHTAVFTDANVTDEMEPVIRRLTLMARQSPDQSTPT